MTDLTKPWDVGVNGDTRTVSFREGLGLRATIIPFAVLKQAVAAMLSLEASLEVAMDRESKANTRQDQAAQKIEQALTLTGGKDA